ncbi:hypothetical protein M5K25_017638 [Dendrobium thyrsiflorum]|uniref:Uncharacterized protein n=1 Tax=Dendrobium thyrsiflorum TaxID=117978 RepID=A0ABD0UNB6_DENTH
MDGNFSSLGEMLKKFLEGQPKMASSKAREAFGNPGSGKNSNPIRQREDQEVNTRKEKKRIPLLEPIFREEPGRGYGEKRENVEHEQRGAEFERRGAEFERERGNHDRRRAKTERRGVYYDPRGAEFERRM